MASLDFGPHRTSQDYRFTVTDVDDPAILALKQQAAAHNVEIRRFARKTGNVSKMPWSKLQRVRLMGRGPRETETSGMRYWSYLPQYTGLATHYDVYLSEDTSGQDLLRQEIATGMRPGELAKVAELKTAIWKLEMKGHTRVRNR